MSEVVDFVVAISIAAAAAVAGVAAAATTSTVAGGDVLFVYSIVSISFSSVAARICYTKAI